MLPDSVAVVRHDGRGNITGESVAGDLEPVSEREILSSFFAFRLKGETDGRYVFIRVVNHDSFATTVRFLPENQFERFRFQTDMIHAIVVAVIVFMILYNLTLSVLIRDLAFFLNAVLVTGLLAVNVGMNGFGVAYIWAGHEQWSNEIFIHASALNTAAACMFVYVW